MSRRKPVELATRNFNTQDEATVFFSAMLNRYKPRERVSEEDHLDLVALLERHPEFHAKVGCGVDHFQIMMTDQGTQCFRIVRIDGTGTDFSIKKCISHRASNRKQQVSEACRRAVRFEIYKARDEFLAKHMDAEAFVTCAKTCDRIRREDAHIDHLPPMTFEVIVTTFLCHRGLSFDDVSLRTGQDDQVSPELVDEKLAEDFRSYHTNVARLDFIKNTSNLAQASRHRLKAGRVSLDAHRRPIGGLHSEP
jgi:hypothetical protein